ncbi:hypothetical protein ACFZCY_02265 [Streptomyces sp. NPDC007983]|uniref:hypothetical protein n=1 Tax=Streptomyces sp. NPDC007983 TaxID=3364800 RepID=UPI0036EF5245
MNAEHRLGLGQDEGAVGEDDVVVRDAEQLGLPLGHVGRRGRKVTVSRVEGTRRDRLAHRCAHSRHQ